MNQCLTLFPLFLCLTILLTSNGYSLKVRKLAPTGSLQLKATSPALIGKADLDWPNLGFAYRTTNSFVTVTHKDGKWGSLERETDPFIKVHIGATALHYGQACFEGLKAFHCKDGKVKIFRPEENAKRISNSCKRVCMPEIPEPLFLEAVKTAVADNLEFLPPYGTGGAMYIRPFVFGSGPRIGLQPSDEYKFIVMVMPVADYYRGGLSPVTAVVIEDFDRAAPKGVGNVKVAGNYAADILPNTIAKQQGYPIALYLDALTNKYVEEFSTSNFVAVSKKGTFVTPDSKCILPSITNKSLMQMAADEGYDVEVRPIAIEELKQGGFTEVGACGTAVVVTPVNQILYKNELITIGTEVGPVLRKLYDRIRGVQNGEIDDKFNWMVEV